MSKALDSILAGEIGTLTAFLRNLPADLCQDLCIPHALIDVKFGPDVETRFLKDGSNMMKSMCDSMDIVDRARDQFKNTDILCSKDPVLRDGSMLETRLEPCDPLKICDHYNQMARRLYDVADAMRAQAHVGHGHWHVSMAQDGHNLFQSHPFMRYRAAAGIVFFQKTFPAFFVKPHIAENDYQSYAGPTCLMFQKVSADASVRLHSQHSTLEPRLAKHAPYQPAYLTLAGIRHGLENGSCDPEFDEPLKFIGGKFEYLTMLETARRNIDDCPVIPRDIALALFERSLEDYRAYLQSPRIALAAYTREQEAYILNRLDEWSASARPGYMPIPQVA